MKPELDETIRHAVMAHHDGELTSIVVLMVTTNKEPEMHMAVNTDDIHIMNTATDMLKIEMMKIISASSDKKEDRE